MASLQEMKEQLVSLLGKMDRNTKIKLALGLVGSLALVLGIVLLTRPQYEVLFANLTAGDVGEITTRLEQIDVPFQLANNGTTILVPKDEVYRVRNQLVMEGMPRGGIVDFGIFDEIKLGMTDFERRVQYRRALQGELTRTIMAMKGIKNAWVQINLPEPRLYLTQEKKASAAILVETMGELKPAQVWGIIHLVSRSVEGLEPEMVTVVDTRGQVLSQDVALENSFLGLTASQLELQRQLERQLEQNIQAMLERAYGWGRVVTRVRAELDFDQREVTTQRFDPEGIVRSEQELERTYQGQGTAAGVPGTTSNLPPIYQEIQGGNSEYYEREITRNFEISEVREHLVVAPGEVKRLSVAVLIDERELSPEQRLAIEEIEEAVAAAVGLDYSRGDQITVTTLPFAQPPSPAQEEVEPVTTPGTRWYRYLLWVGVALVAGVLLYRLLRRRESPYAPPLEEVAPAEEERGEETQREQVTEQIKRLARQRPETVAELLRSWLAED